MRSAYRVLSSLIALGVLVQAASMALHVFTLRKDIDAGKTINDEYENVGLLIHIIDGMMVIPLLALILLIVSFLAKIPGGVKWAGFILLAVVVQFVLAGFGHGVPAIGALHGLNAFVIFSLAVRAHLLTRGSEATAARADETVGARTV